MFTPTRHTNQRQAVLRAIKLSTQPLRPAEVYRAVRQYSQDISQATVYRSLHWLTKRGEVYQVEGEDGTKRFIGHAYHRLTTTCQRCGRVRHQAEISLPSSVRPQLTDFPMVFFSAISVGGLCGDCQKKMAKETKSV